MNGELFFAVGFLTLSIVGVVCTIAVVQALNRNTRIAHLILDMLCGDATVALRLIQSARRGMPPSVHRGPPPPTQAALYRDRRR